MLSKPRVQYTIAAFYGQKPQEFVSFLDGIREIISNHPLGRHFQPYANDQVHTTLMGLERLMDRNHSINLNRYEATGEACEMRLEGCVDLFESFLDGVRIRLGGFNPAYDQFLSWEARPYQRSFGIHASTGKVVLNGWPVLEGTGSVSFTDGVWQLRKNLHDKHNLRHKYHQYEDNDVFMVVGDLPNPHHQDTEDHQVFNLQRKELEDDVRTFLSTSRPYYLKLSIEDIAVIGYQDPVLPPHETQVYPLNRLRTNLPQMRSLFSEK